MIRAWLLQIAAFLPARNAVAEAIPVLETDRLILRAPRIEDWPALEPIWRTERGAFIGGPFDEEDAWLDFTQAVASWVLRGIGYWTVTRRTDGAVLGLCGLGQEYTDPEPEFGWLVTEAAEGHGYALEAASAIRDHLFAQGLPTCVSYVDADHGRSRRLAERLGAHRDTRAEAALPVETAGTLVYRHPAPEPRP